ncbi:MAG: hypothetical protein U5L96_05115 [Owenweeksia sp.]|nr:hypothetical protein [Owenweeksia sp.]
MHAAIKMYQGSMAIMTLFWLVPVWGGVISRYALAKDEEQQNQQGTSNYLPVSHYVSLDAPHKGAVISQELLSYTKQYDDGNYTFNTKAFEQLVRNNKFESSSPPVEPAFYSNLRKS